MEQKQWADCLCRLRGYSRVADSVENLVLEITILDNTSPVEKAQCKSGYQRKKFELFEVNPGRSVRKMHGLKFLSNLLLTFEEWKLLNWIGLRLRVDECFAKGTAGRRHNNNVVDD